MKSCYEKAQEQKKELVRLGKIKSFKYVLSYGGGVNSSALFFYLLENNYELDLVIYADTGEDEKTTYESIAEMKQVCKENNVEFVVVQSKLGNMYNYYHDKKAVMSFMKRDCTGKFKVYAINNYLRSRFGKKTHFITYIGHAYDEKHRVTESKVKYVTLIYPFVDDKIIRREHEEILNNNSFFAVKSGCKGCIYKKKKDWVDMFINDRVEFDRWRKLEENNSKYPKVSINGNFTLKQIADNWKDQSFLSSFENEEKGCKSGYCNL